MTFLIALCVYAHSFHVSVCQIDIKAASIEITSTIFADDLEQAINSSEQAIKVDIFNEEKHEAQAPLIEKYLKKHLQLKNKEQILDLHFLGYEVINNQCFTYWESKSMVSQQELDLQNTILCELFKDQKNLVHVNNGEDKKTLMFDQRRRVKRIQ